MSCKEHYHTFDKLKKMFGLCCLPAIHIQFTKLEFRQLALFYIRLRKGRMTIYVDIGSLLIKVYLYVVWNTLGNLEF